MPPKKNATAAAPSSPAPGTATGGDDKFSWSIENECKLLILCMGRSTIGPKDYQDFVNALPGSTYNGIRFRISKFRKDQAEIYTKHGWTLPETNGAGAKVSATPGTATKAPKIPKEPKAAKAPAAKGKKRTASGANIPSDADIDTNSADTVADADADVDAGTKKAKNAKKPRTTVKKDALKDDAATANEAGDEKTHEKEHFEG